MFMYFYLASIWLLFDSMWVRCVLCLVFVVGFVWVLFGFGLGCIPVLFGFDVGLIWVRFACLLWFYVFSSLVEFGFYVCLC